MRQYRVDVPEMDSFDLEDFLNELTDTGWEIDFVIRRHSTGTTKKIPCYSLNSPGYVESSIGSFVIISSKKKPS